MAAALPNDGRHNQRMPSLRGPLYFQAKAVTCLGRRRAPRGNHRAQFVPGTALPKLKLMPRNLTDPLINNCAQLLPLTAFLRPSQGPQSRRRALAGPPIDGNSVRAKSREKGLSRYIKKSASSSSANAEISRFVLAEGRINSRNRPRSRPCVFGHKTRNALLRRVFPGRPLLTSSSGQPRGAAGARAARAQAFQLVLTARLSAHASLP